MLRRAGSRPPPTDPATRGLISSDPPPRPIEQTRTRHHEFQPPPDTSPAARTDGLFFLFSDDGTKVSYAESEAREVHAAMVEYDAIVPPFSPHDRHESSRARLVEALGDEVGYVFSSARNRLRPLSDSRDFVSEEPPDLKVPRRPPDARRAPPRAASRGRPRPWAARRCLSRSADSRRT